MVAVMLYRPAHNETDILTKNYPGPLESKQNGHILTHQMLTFSLVALVNVNLENSYVKLSIS